MTSKYRNKRVVVDNITFDSKAEAKRYGELRLLEKAGKITWPITHPAYRLEINGMLICVYIADFNYMNRETGGHVVEDVKGARTEAYKIKRKLMKAIYGIDIVEIQA